MQRDMTPGNMPHGVLQQIELMKLGLSNPLYTPGRRYKHDFDKKVRQESSFKARYYVLLDCPQFAAIPSDTGSEMTNQRHDNLLRRSSGPYSVLSIEHHAVTIGKEGMQNTVFIYRITLSPTREQMIHNLAKRR